MHKLTAGMYADIAANGRHDRKCELNKTKHQYECEQGCGGMCRLQDIIDDNFREVRRDKFN
ncbi:hypothetical protein PBN151_4370 [Paenibacillus sp. NAIST15-1]|nr:hypothetical protein PBN151_4370 [Paenibacillus sp. NAIST15-1]